MPPSLEIEHHDVLERASFRLASARIAWGRGRRSTGWGRDRSPDVAVEKAVCEAVERFSYTCLPPVVRRRARDLGRCVDPHALVRYEPEQRGAHGIPARPFDVDDERYWVRARRVRAAGSSYVLADFVCNPIAFDAAYRSRLVTQASTSGCASAYRLADAILRASLELVERDAFMRHWFARRPGRAVEVATLPERIRARVEALRASGCAAGVQCLHLGAHPTWLAWSQHARLRFTCIGSASGLDAVDALESAMNELETTALARIEGVPARHVDPADVADPADHAALYATEAYFRRADALWFGDADPVSFDDARAAFAPTPDAFHDAVERRGHQLHWIDLSTDEALNAPGGRPIHTVRVVGTELIPLCFGFGRLPLGMDRWRAGDPTVLHPCA